ncbi:hypothetical protein SRHO_G00298030 [Serrasalmus rhombeus]
MHVCVYMVGLCQGQSRSVVVSDRGRGEGKRGKELMWRNERKRPQSRERCAVCEPLSGAVRGDAEGVSKTG